MPHVSVYMAGGHNEPPDQEWFYPTTREAREAVRTIRDHYRQAGVTVLGNMRDGYDMVLDGWRFNLEITP